MSELDWPCRTLVGEYWRVRPGVEKGGRVETAEINGPIGICGVRVDPGDVMIGDESGVTVVPRQIAPDVLALC